MTVGEMRATMSNDEFIRWTIYHGRRAQENEMRSK